MAHALQDRFSSIVDAKLRSVLVTRNIVNTKFEGTPKAGAVKIVVRDDETTLADYSRTNVSGNALTYGTTKYITATLDKDKFVNEYVDKEVA